LLGIPEFSLRLVDEPEMIIGLGIVRLEVDRLLHRRDRVRRPPLALEVDLPEQQMRIGELRLKLNGLLRGCNRLVVPVLLEQLCGLQVLIAPLVVGSEG